MDIGAIEYCEGRDTLLNFSGYQPMVFPNPAQMEATLRFLVRPGVPAKVTLTTMQGLICWQQTITTPVPGIRDLHLPLQWLPAGLYLITVRSATEIRFVKLLKR